jgi:hypothetical protein
MLLGGSSVEKALRNAPGLFPGAGFSGFSLTYTYRQNLQPQDSKLLLSKSHQMKPEHAAALPCLGLSSRYRKHCSRLLDKQVKQFCDIRRRNHLTYDPHAGALATRSMLRNPDAGSLCLRGNKVRYRHGACHRMPLGFCVHLQRGIVVVQTTLELAVSWVVTRMFSLVAVVGLERLRRLGQLLS